MNTILYKRLPMTLAVAGFAALLAFPAQAEDQMGASTPVAQIEKGMKDGEHKRHRGDFIPMDDSDMEKIEKMTQEERQTFFKDRREAFKKMTPEEKKSLIEKRKEWFNSLSPEKKEALKERHKKMRDEWKARKKAEFEKLSPEEQAKVKAKMEERKAKWKEKGEDRRGHRPGDDSPEGPDHGPDHD